MNLLFVIENKIKIVRVFVIFSFVDLFNGWFEVVEEYVVGVFFSLVLNDENKMVIGVFGVIFFFIKVMCLGFFGM